MWESLLPIPISLEEKYILVGLVTGMRNGKREQFKKTKKPMDFS